MRGQLLRLATALIAFLAAAPLWSAPAPDVTGSLEWRLVGPFRGGWATTVAGAGGASNTFYLGAAGGGVWKTDDAGLTWHVVFDGVGSASVGALAVAPSRPDTVYAGMGQVTSRYDIAPGDGVYRSDDAGRSWRSVGLAATRHIGEIIVDPRDPQSVLVAALGSAFGPNNERGVYRTTDGGKSWTRTLFVSENTGAVDLAFDPADPQVVFASVWQVRYRPWLAYFTPDTGPESGVYRSGDGGATWTRITGGGWPANALGRIGLAVVHRTQGTRVWAVVDAEKNGGLYRSDDAGRTWLHVNDDHELVSSYFAKLTPVPGDADTVFSMGRGIQRCTKGGTVCEVFKGAPGGDDYHFLWIDPQHPERMITGADQGAVITTNGGGSWSSWYNQPTGQFYKLATDSAFPYRIFGGQQDSGTVRISSRSDDGSITFRDWRPVGGDERDYQVADPRNPDIVYSSGLGGRLSRWDARNGEVQNVTPWPIASYGQRPTDFQFRYSWITPIAISPLAPYPLYFGSQQLWRSTDQGAHWEAISPDLSARGAQPGDCRGNLDPPRARECGYGVIWSIGLSPRDNDEIWIGTDDGIVRMTGDGGKFWTDVTPKDVPHWAKISTVEPSALEPGVAYVAVDNHRQDDFRPLVYRTRDNGASWSLVVNGLPADHFVSVVRPDPVKAGLLYAGTDIGAYYSIDDGANWQPLQRNLPTAWVRDLLVKDDDLIAATQGRAIWVLDGLAPLRQAAAIAAGGKAHLFAPAPAIRLRKNQNHDTPLPPEEPAGTNPPTGRNHRLLARRSGPPRRTGNSRHGRYRGAQLRKRCARRAAGRRTLFCGLVAEGTRHARRDCGHASFRMESARAATADDGVRVLARHRVRRRGRYVAGRPVGGSGKLPRRVARGRTGIHRAAGGRGGSAGRRGRCRARQGACRLATGAAFARPALRDCCADGIRAGTPRGAAQGERRVHGSRVRAGCLRRKREAAEARRGRLAGQYRHCRYRRAVAIDRDGPRKQRPCSDGTAAARAHAGGAAPRQGGRTLGHDSQE